MESFRVNGKFRRSQTVSGSLLFEEKGKNDRLTLQFAQDQNLIFLSKPDPLAACEQGGQHVPWTERWCWVLLPSAHEFFFSSVFRKNKGSL